MTILVIFTALTYFIIIGSFFWGWNKIKPVPPIVQLPQTKVSIIIPVRNEQSAIRNLIQSLLLQNYPTELTEIIIIDDHSTDETLGIISNLRTHGIQIIQLQKNLSGKKAALLEGSKLATGELIVTTDADCEPNPEWISTLVSFYVSANSVLIIAPVLFQPLKSIFAKFQALEFLSLQGSSAGAIGINKPIMCNGANLAYSRECLPIVQATYKNSKTASGDDVFTLLAVKKTFPGRTHFIKSEKAVVYTTPSITLQQFLNQRKRWTVKARFYNDPLLIITALSVLSVSFLLSILFVYSCFTGNWLLFSILFLVKNAIDLPFLYQVCSFFKAKKLLWWFPVVQSFYFLYVSFTFVWSLFGGYVWKSRKLRN
jgi:poly-beta-1,6-N-acetyl-D-glucosamine synthase